MIKEMIKKSLAVIAIALLALALVVVACDERIVGREAVTKKGHLGARSLDAYKKALWLYRQKRTDDLKVMYLSDRIFDLPLGQRVLVLLQTANGLVELEALDYPYEGERWWASEKAIEIMREGRRKRDVD